MRADTLPSLLEIDSKIECANKKYNYCLMWGEVLRGLAKLLII